jgi:hypothetical protein
VPPPEVTGAPLEPLTLGVAGELPPALGFPEEPPLDASAPAAPGEGVGSASFALEQAANARVKGTSPRRKRNTAYFTTRIPSSPVASRATKASLAVGPGGREANHFKFPVARKLATVRFSLTLTEAKRATLGTRSRSVFDAAVADRVHAGAGFAGLVSNDANGLGGFRRDGFGLRR